MIDYLISAIYNFINYILSFTRKSDVHIVLDRIIGSKTVINNAVKVFIGLQEEADQSKVEKIVDDNQRFYVGNFRSEADYFTINFSRCNSFCTVHKSLDNTPIFAFSDKDEVLLIRQALKNKLLKQIRLKIAI
jgi:hypothetical protein